MFRLTTLTLRKSCFPSLELQFSQKRKYVSTEKLIQFKDTYLKLDKITEIREQLGNKLKDIKDKNVFAPKEKLTEKITRKGTEVNNWYIKTIGLDQVKVLQDRVVTMQAELAKAQDIRRDYDTLLKEKRVHLNKLQEQINKINRYQDSSSGLKYMELIQEEMKEINIEKELNIKFDDADKKERELFTAFCIAIRDSHDKERSQAEYTKYFGIILSIIGTIVGSILTLIVNSVRTRDLLSGIESVIENQMRIKDEKLDLLSLHVKGLVEKINDSKNNIFSSNNNSNTVLSEVRLEDDWSSKNSSATKIVTGFVISYLVLKIFGF